MSAKINLYSGLVPTTGTAVSPREGYVYVVTKVTFRSETDSIGNVSAGSPGREKLVGRTIAARGEVGWEGTQVIEHGEWLNVAAAPADSIRCVVEGYFLVNVPFFAAHGAGSMDEAYGKNGAIQTQDSSLAKLTYLVLVELKRMRASLDSNSTISSTKSMAEEEIERELGV